MRSARLRSCAGSVCQSRFRRFNSLCTGAFARRCSSWFSPCQNRKARVRRKDIHGRGGTTTIVVVSVAEAERVTMNPRGRLARLAREFLESELNGRGRVVEVAGALCGRGSLGDTGVLGSAEAFSLKTQVPNRVAQPRMKNGLLFPVCPGGVDGKPCTH